MATAPAIKLPTVQFASPQWWRERFDAVHPVTAKWEGGEVNHKDDPGGHTNLGVTQANYTAWLKEQGLPNKSVKYITKGEAVKLYYDKYWTPTAIKYKLVPGVDLATYDAGVNSGVSRGIKWLIAGASKTNDHVATVKGICGKRLSFVQALKTWTTFGRGWARRIADVEAKGVAMAAAYMHVSKSAVQNELSKGAKEAEADRKSNATKTGGTAAGGVATGATGTEPNTVAPDGVSPEAAQVLLYGLTAVLVIAVVYFLVRTYVAKARRDAYKKELAHAV